MEDVISELVKITAILTQMASSSAWNPTVVIALIAAIGGPAVALVVMRQTLRTQSRLMETQLTTQSNLTERQLLGTIRSSNRQDWINQLRKDVATFLSIMGEIKLEVKKLDPKAAKNVEFPDALKNKIFEGGKLKILTELRLNPDENDHVQLMGSLEQIGNYDLSTDDFTILRGDIVSLTQRILKDEWVRVKKGE